MIDEVKLRPGGRSSLERMKREMWYKLASEGLYMENLTNSVKTI
jgi:hypothetical protein